MKLKLGVLFILIFMFSCRDKIEHHLTEENSVWLYSIKDATNNNSEKTMRLQFFNNGVADEVDTDFINYKWSYNHLRKSIIINGQEFIILSRTDDIIYLKHSKTGFEARLSKVR